MNNKHSGDKRSEGSRSDNMYKAILTLKNVEELRSFFDDLCTSTELSAMEQRYHVAELLNKDMIYNEILEKTGASSATISRVNRALTGKYSEGGYELVFSRLKALEGDAGEEGPDKK